MAVLAYWIGSAVCPQNKSSLIDNLCTDLYTNLNDVSSGIYVTLRCGKARMSKNLFIQEIG